MSGIILPRRGFLRAGLLALPALTPGGVRAADLLPTPPQTEGPFYPDELPRDTDSDLVRVTGADAQALGRVTHVLGRILDRHGRPLPGLPVEIWQCDAHGATSPVATAPGSAAGRRATPASRATAAR